MAGNVTWTGMQEYLAELRRLPGESKGEAEKLIRGTVNGAFVTVAGVYEQHQHTGTLRRRLKISDDGKQLTSGSPLAWLFDNGSQARHWASGKSTGRMWGRTPPTHIFAKTVGRARRKLTEAYKAMLLRRGATSVTGE